MRSCTLCQHQLLFSLRIDQGGLTPLARSFKIFSTLSITPSFPAEAPFNASDDEPLGAAAVCPPVVDAPEAGCPPGEAWPLGAGPPGPGRPPGGAGPPGAGPAVRAEDVGGRPEGEEEGECGCILHFDNWFQKRKLNCQKQEREKSD